MKIELATAEVLPLGPEFNVSGQLPFSVLFDNRKSLFRNIFHISLLESIFWSLNSM
jgi:hypothetical protein